VKTRAVRARRFGGVIALCVITLAATAGSRQTGAPVSAGASPDSISGVLNQIRTVDLVADMQESGKLLATYTVTLVWDSTIVRLDSVRGGAFGDPDAVNYMSGGEVRLTKVNSTGMSGAFTLAKLHFRFVNDTIGKRTPIQATFIDFAATDFTDLRSELTTISGVARVLPATVNVGFTPDSIRERVGFMPLIEMTADLASATGAGLGSYAATVTWDPAIMILETVSAGDYAAPQFNQTSAGELRLTGADPQGRSGTFALARLQFRFVGTAYPTETGLGLLVTEMHEALTFADLLPGVRTSGGKALIGGVLRGDVDVSGTVAALDAQLILQGVVGLPLGPGVAGVPNGDADCTGALSAKDAQVVLNFVVGNDVTQFCAGKIQ
jgi:hypothetical protein